MAALNFPDNPSVNDEFIAANGRRWVWNGTAWMLGFGALNIGATGPAGPAGAVGNVVMGSTAPTAPSAGDLFFNTDESVTYIYYNDDWTVMSGGGGGGASVTVATTAPESPSEGDMWYDSDSGQTFIYYDSFWVEVGPTAINNISSTVTSKGDLMVASGSASLARLGVGTDDQLLIADSNASNGVKWGSSISGLTLSSATITGPSVSGGTIADSTLTDPVVNRATFVAPLEKWSIVATAPPTTTNIDVITSSILYYTSNTSANITLNIRGDSTTTLNSLLDVGESITAGLIVTNGATAYRPTVFQVDGANVTPKWQGGSAPTAGNANSTDSYIVTVVKTAATPTYTVIASQTLYA